MNPASWSALFAALFQVFQECKAAGQPPEAIRDQIRNPRGVGLLRLNNAARQSVGMSRRDWRRDDARREAILAEVHAERQQLTDADIDEFLADD